MNLLKELSDLITEGNKTSSVTKTTASKVYHRDYVRTKTKKYRKYNPQEHEQQK
jgi:hypothetical protein